MKLHYNYRLAGELLILRRQSVVRRDVQVKGQAYRNIRKCVNDVTFSKSCVTLFSTKEFTFVN
jgi:hypothetical protein